MPRKEFATVGQDTADEWPWTVLIKVFGSEKVILHAEDETSARKWANLLNEAATQWAEEK